MRAWALPLSCALWLLSAPAPALVIDDLTAPQVVTGPEPPYPGHSAIDVANPLAANRNVGVGGSVTPDSSTLAIGGGSLSYSITEAGVFQSGSVAWFLVDPVDLTEGGTKSALRISVTEQTLATDLSIYLRACGPGLICYHADSTTLVDLVGARDYSVPLDLFSETAPGADAPVDLTAVTYVGLQFVVDPNAPPGGIQISGPIATVPEPGAALFALLAALVTLTRR